MFGAFTALPSFLYAFLVLVGYLLAFSLIKNASLVKPLLIHCAIIALGVLAFYTPILFFSGIERFASNDFVEPLPRYKVAGKLVQHLFEIYHYQLLANTDFLVMIVASIWLVFQRLSIRYLGIAFAFAPALLMLLHSVLPPARTWIFLVPIYLLVLSLFATRYKYTVSRNLFIIILILIPTLISFHTVERIRFEIENPRKVNFIAKRIKEIGGKKILVPKHGYLPSIQFELRNLKDSEVIDKKSLKTLKPPEYYDIIIAEEGSPLPFSEFKNHVKVENHKLIKVPPLTRGRSPAYD